MLEENQSKSGSLDSQPGDPARLTALVERYQVCWEVYPLEILAKEKSTTEIPVKEGIRKIGFDLELYGTPECGTEHVMPGCEHCRRVEIALEEIADWIMQRESPSCTHIVSPDGAELSYAPVRANRPDVTVRVFMAHRHQWDQPTDECEERCLKEIEQALAELGACKGGWSGARDESPAGRS
jgi:hypothetical protein